MCLSRVPDDLFLRSHLWGRHWAARSDGVYHIAGHLWLSLQWPGQYWTCFVSILWILSVMICCVYFYYHILWESTMFIWIIYFTYSIYVLFVQFWHYSVSITLLASRMYKWRYVVATRVVFQGLSSLGNNFRLKDLNLSECTAITDLGLQKFAQQCREIERLDISHCMVWVGPKWVSSVNPRNAWNATGIFSWDWSLIKNAIKKTAHQYETKLRLSYIFNCFNGCWTIKH